MSKYIPGNQKHLSLEDRKYIERSLNNGSTFKDIARFLCKDPTTISKEVKLHRVSDWYHKGSFLNAHNFCIHRYHCRKTNVCRKIILCNIKCTSCPTCNQTCPDFVKEQCNRLDKAPYVCNGCPKAIHHCSIAHKYRSPLLANIRSSNCKENFSNIFSKLKTIILYNSSNSQICCDMLRYRRNICSCSHGSFSSCVPGTFQKSIGIYALVFIDIPPNLYNSFLEMQTCCIRK